MTTATYTTSGIRDALAEIPRLRLSAYLAVLFLELVLLVSLGTV